MGHLYDIAKEDTPEEEPLHPIAKSLLELMEEGMLDTK